MKGDEALPLRFQQIIEGPDRVHQLCVAPEILRQVGLKGVGKPLRLIRIDMPTPPVLRIPDLGENQVGGGGSSWSGQVPAALTATRPRAGRNSGLRLYARR